MGWVTVGEGVNATGESIRLQQQTRVLKWGASMPMTLPRKRWRIISKVGSHGGERLVAQGRDRAGLESRFAHLTTAP